VSGLLQIWHQFAGLFTTALQRIAEFYGFLGDYRWAAAIVTMTLIVRTLLLPVAIKQIKSMRDQQRLLPEVSRIRQKYKSDRQKLTEEMMELYRREGVNPYASCLPLIAQMPVFIVMFRVIRQLTTVSKSVTKELAPKAKVLGITVEELARRTGVIPKMPFLGLGDLAKAAYTTPAGWLLLILMTGTQWFSTRQLNPGGTDQQQRMQQLMPFFFVFIMFRFPGALVLYWTTTTVYQFVQQNVMLRGWSPAKWFSKPEPPPKRPAASQAGRPASAAPQRPETPRPPAAPVPTSQTFGSALGLSDPVARRELSEKRMRRRRKKRKRKN
jgi:YidC/Oxa1 family membrane protein insertase